MNSDPLSKCRPKIRNGYCSSIAVNTGIRYASLIFGAHPTTSHCVTASTELRWYTPLRPSQSP